MYKPNPALIRVWGLEDRGYSEAEVKASPHLQGAVECGALVPDETKTKPRASAREEATA